MKSVGVIGAGAAGLCAVRHLLCRNGFRPIVFEKSSTVGGTWVYTDEPSCEHSTPLYRNLITNLPKQVMQFPDFPFENVQPTFLPHQEVLNYLQRYCEAFELSDHIKLNHSVENVAPIKTRKTSLDPKWKVTVRNLRQNELCSYHFDALLVCNGHYSDPYKPCISGIKNFKGNILHSCEYRKASQFANQSILLVGAGASGIDIAIELSRTAHKVFLSHRQKPIKSFLPSNIIEISEVQNFEDDGHTVTFKCGLEAQCTSVIFCTGFNYSFPFLDRDCGISVNRSHVQPLFNHIVNINYPSMIFIGLPAQVLPFRLFHMQVLYGLGVLTKQIHLPTKKEMFQQLDVELNQFGNSEKTFKAGHVMTGRLIEYLDQLAESGVENIPENIKNLYLFVLRYRERNLTSYKSETFSIDQFDSIQMDKN